MAVVTIRLMINRAPFTSSGVTDEIPITSDVWFALAEVAEAFAPARRPFLASLGSKQTKQLALRAMQAPLATGTANLPSSTSPRVSLP